MLSLQQRKTDGIHCYPYVIRKIGSIPALGLHPLFLARHQHQHLDQLEAELRQPAVVAVGEIGLDYFIKEADVDAQKKLLDTQLALASKTQLPVILHCRKAYDDLIAMLKLYPLQGGIAHAFNGSIQQAYKLIDMGYKLGFGGTLTYENARKIRQLAKSVPISSIVLETDSPDMTVSRHTGERNSPAYLPYVLQALDEIRTESKQVLAEQTYQNSVDVFKLS